jgi:hypothetical protein
MLSCNRRLELIPWPDVADTHIDGYVCLRGTVLIYVFDQELHSTVRAQMRQYDEREGGFLLGKGHACPSCIANTVNVIVTFHAKSFWCDGDDACCCNPDSHKC